MMNYEEHICFDASGVTLRKVSAAEQAQTGTMLIPLHTHDFYELTLVLHNGCEFFCAGKRTFLIPGDLFLVRLGESHAYRLQSGAALYQCHFEAGVCASSLRYLLEMEPAPPSALQRRMRNLWTSKARPPGGAEHPHFAVDESGLMHLSYEEASSVQALYEQMLREQDGQMEGFAQMKESYLSQMLVLLMRIRTQQFKKSESQTSWKQEMVDAVLRQIDENLTQTVDFEAIARKQGIALSYFRAVFKGIVGTTPTDYLNRVRALKALELLQTTNLSIAEVAMSVGIYDANYFSRLFKKVIGYPPRYFKSLPKTEL